MDLNMDDDDRGMLHCPLPFNRHISNQLLGSGSSDNDQDELMEDVDEVDAEPDMAEGDDDDNDDNDGDENDDEDQDDSLDRQDSPQRASNTETGSDDLSPVTTRDYRNGGPTSHPRDLSHTSASPLNPVFDRLHPSVRPEALTASLYDIVPTMAAPQSTSINAIAATPDMRYWFTGGSDCYIRKYDGAATVNGRTLLTVAQRHPFVDTVTKAGVLMSYWENDEPVARSTGGEDTSLSPVYSLAVHSEAIWLLSGLESGCIALQSVRHDEGKRIVNLQKHTNAVSVLTLASDEKSVLSGSWDKNIFDWDLNTGLTKRSFVGSGGQISAIEIRPASSLPVPEESGEPVVSNGTFSSNNGVKPLMNGFMPNGVNGTSNGAPVESDGVEDAQGSPADTDSLFGGGDAGSLFGDNEGAGGSGGNFGDDEYAFSRVIDMNAGQQEQLDAPNDGIDATIGGPAMATMDDIDAGTAPPVQRPAENASSTGIDAGMKTALVTNGLPHAEDASDSSATAASASAPETQDAVATSDSTFLAASIDGTLRVWDRRQEAPVATVPNRPGVPPWCMGACWSPDGNYIYAGRRNGTVEEFSLHKGLKGPERTFKFPQGSGAVSAVRAMPNGRHLIW
jgi:transcriptional activator SPT8